MFGTLRGRITNTGDRPRFIGLLPSPKAHNGFLVFGSVTELKVGLYLEWSRTVRQISYERCEVTFEADGDLPALRAFPDFEIELTSGETAWIEAKYSQQLSQKVREKLAILAEHCHRQHRRFEIITRKDLEQDGFIDTVLLLRPYGQLVFADELVGHAMSALASSQALDLGGWRRLARRQGILIDLLYFLLYHQALPLTYRAFSHWDLL